MFKKILKLAMCLLISLSIIQHSPSVVHADENSQILNVPQVEKYTQEESGIHQINTSSRFVILMNSFTQDSVTRDSLVQQINSQFAAKGVADGNVLPIIKSTPTSVGSGDIIFEWVEGFEDEENKIIIADTITIQASTDRAMMYGATTILQLFLTTNNNIPKGIIEDKPMINERSFHLDMARKFYTKEWTIELLKELSWLKYNTVQLHFSENEGFRIESKSHPEIVSDQHWTIEETKEILAVAKDYQLDIIPSFDTPGHLEQALKNHPEFQMKNRYNQPLRTGLDITNPNARLFIKEIIDEYAELFKDSKYFHIGADEFINFDQYNNYPILEQYAKENISPTATGVDTFYDYINDIASYVEEKGFIVRAWNDGLYRIGQSHEVELKDSIEITYWTSWDPKMAPVKTFLDLGHKVVNYNDAYFYYVLGENAGYKYPTGSKIYDGWHPGLFPGRNPQVGGNTKQEYAEPYNEVLGTTFAIWSDRPTAQTEAQVANGIHEPIRAKIERDWNGRRETSSYSDFKLAFDIIGEAPGYGTELPTPSEIKVGSDIGTVVIEYQDELGETILPSKRYFGENGENISLQAPIIYGYELLGDPEITGTFTANSTQTIVLKYQLTTNKDNLWEAIVGVENKDAYFSTEYTPYLETVAKGLEVLKNERASQETIDSAINTILNAKNLLIGEEKVVLKYYLDNTYDSGSFTKLSYQNYNQALVKAQSVLLEPVPNSVKIQEAILDIQSSLAQLEALKGIDASAKHNGWQGAGPSNMLDGDLSTMYWSEGEQKGSWIEFNFHEPVTLNSMIINSVGAKGDLIDGADIKYSTDHSNWTTLKYVGKEEIIEVDFGGVEAQYVRFDFTTSTTNWLKINEVIFDYETSASDFIEIIKEYENQDITGYTSLSATYYETALLEANRIALLEGNTYLENAIINALDTAKDNLVTPQSVDTTKLETMYSELVELSLDKYVPNSTTLLRKALDVSKQSLSQDMHTEQVNVLIEILNYSKSLLVEKSNNIKDELIALVSEVEAIDLSKYTKDSVEELQTVLNNAKTLLAKEEAEVSEYENMLLSLTTAKEGLKIEDKTNEAKDKLIALVSEVEAIDLSKYTKSSVQELQTVLNNAKTLLAKEDVEAAEYENMLLSLTTAKEGLKIEDKTNEAKDKLIAFVNEVEALDLSKYTKDSVEELQTVLNNAKTLLAKEDVEAAEYENMLLSLTAAKEGLVYNKGTTPTPIQGMEREYKLKVGESVTIEPTPEKGSWIFDSNFLKGTFNSPATFTALKAGTTTVRYESLEGEVFETTFVITENTIEEENKPVLPKTGINSLNSSIALTLVGIGVLVIVKKKQNNNK